MNALETPLHFKHAAGLALAEGDHMMAMDLFAEAAERAHAEGRTELAEECALQVLNIIAEMAEVDGFEIFGQRPNT